MDVKKLIESPEWYAGEHCIVCGSPNIQKHHIIGGSGRRNVSDKYGYILPLCYEHHVGANGIHRNRGMQLFWMETAQLHFELHHGSRADFIKEFGRSYL